MCGIGTMSTKIIPNYSTSLGIPIKNARMAICNKCGETTVHIEEVIRWEKIWHVGFHDRGHGHGDYSIINGVGKLVAKVVTGLLQDANLLAAAPNLLAFAKSFVGDDCMCEPNAEKDDLCTKCRALIVITETLGG